MDFEDNRPLEEQPDVVSDEAEVEETLFVADSEGSDLEEEYEYEFVDTAEPEQAPPPDLSTVYDPNRTRKFFFAYVAAFLGMLVALIPSAVCCRTLGGSYPVFYLFIPLIVFGFMKWFKSFRVSKHIIALLLASVLSAYLTSVVCTALIYMAKNNIPLYEVFRASYFLLADPWTTKDLQNGLLYKILFFAIGCYVSIRLAIYNYRKEKKSDTENGVATKE